MRLRKAVKKAEETQVYREEHSLADSHIAHRSDSLRWLRCPAGSATVLAYRRLLPGGLPGGRLGFQR